MRLTKIALALGLGLAWTAPAWAHQCPALMAEVDKRLEEKTALPEESKKDVQALRAGGEKLHELGDHDRAVSALQQALDILEASK